MQLDKEILVLFNKLLHNSHDATIRDRGIEGMKVGEERRLEVPSALGYGKRGSAPDIPPNADLFFTVTLKKIR